jgi:hypothetical protein
MDETRELHSDPISIMNMGAMVKRDRNHASVVIWSFCNEGGCSVGLLTHAFGTFSVMIVCHGQALRLVTFELVLLVS